MRGTSKRKFLFFVYIFIQFPDIMKKKGFVKRTKGGITMNYEKFEKVRKEQYPMTGQFAYLDTSTSVWFPEGQRMPWSNILKKDLNLR